MSQPWNFTFFEDEIFLLFSYSYGSKVPKWNFAHILLWKKAKNIRKTPKNTWFAPPWLRTTLLNDPVFRFMIQNSYLFWDIYMFHMTINVANYFEDISANYFYDSIFSAYCYTYLMFPIWLKVCCWRSPSLDWKITGEKQSEFSSTDSLQTQKLTQQIGLWSGEIKVDKGWQQ